MSILLKKLLRPVPQTSSAQLYLRQQKYAADRLHPGYAKLRKNQERFQVDDGCPVHLKRGLPDRILLGITTLMSLIGVGWSFKVYYEFIFPKQDDSEDED